MSDRPLYIAFAFGVYRGIIQKPSKTKIPAAWETSKRVTSAPQKSWSVSENTGDDRQQGLQFSPTTRYSRMRCAQPFTLIHSVKKQVRYFPQQEVPLAFLKLPVTVFWSAITMGILGTDGIGLETEWSPLLPPSWSTTWRHFVHFWMRT